jgi:hypothetical protein
MNLKHWRIQISSVLLVAGAATAFGAAGTIGTALSPIGPVNLGDTFTVTLNLSGYTDATEIDGYNFHVAYDSTLFSLVGGSLTLNDAAGAGENWLRLAPQDGVGAGSILTDSTVPGSGTLDISVVDLRVASTRGTTASAGFLYSFDLMTIGLGSGLITPSAGAGGTVLFDTALSSAGIPLFSGGGITVVPEPGPIVLLGSFLIGWLAWRGRRKCNHASQDS